MLAEHPDLINMKDMRLRDSQNFESWVQSGLESGQHTTLSEFLQKGTERPLHDGIKVKLELQWKLHDIGDARTT